MQFRGLNSEKVNVDGYKNKKVGLSIYIYIKKEKMDKGRGEWKILKEEDHSN